MKHVIVIETADDKYLFSSTEQDIVNRVENALKARKITCFIHTNFNEQSAIEAVHDMYNVPYHKELYHG